MKIIIPVILTFLCSVKVYAEYSAKAYCLMEKTTRSVISECNSDEKLPMASTTKIMTALLALENSNPDDMVTISENAERQEGSSAYLRNGDKIPMKELIYGLMLNSGNDAATAAAEYISGSEMSFAELMNIKAKEIGAYNTNFTNPSGLDADNHYTTAYDLSLIACEALDNTDFSEIVKTAVHKTDYSSGTSYFSNHNKLLKKFDGCTGVKTGYTKKAGRCLVTSAKRGEIELVCVTLNDIDDWNDHIKLLDMGFKQVKSQCIVSKSRILKTIPVKNGKNIKVHLSNDCIMPYAKGITNYEVIVHTLPYVEHSIEKGDILGKCDIISNGKIIKEDYLISDENNDMKTKPNFFYNLFTK